MNDSNNDHSPNDNESHSEENVYREIHEWTSSESLNGTVVTALADFKGVETTEMEPLYENINPDALEALFDPNGDGFRADGLVAFSINDHHVTIHSHGEFAVISIREKSSRVIDCGRITDETSFESALQILVQTVARNSIGVAGGWSVERPSTEFPDWEVVITELAERPDDIDHPDE